MNPATHHHQTGEESATQARCVECGQVWPRESMRWGSRPAEPAWFARKVRVLRCPDCIEA
jgi:hypothetical protein